MSKREPSSSDSDLASLSPAQAVENGHSLLEILHAGVGGGAPQHLAILEIELFFRELIPRLKHIELQSEPEWMHAIFVGGLKSMPVAYQF